MSLCWHAPIPTAAAAAGYSVGTRYGGGSRTAAAASVAVPRAASLARAAAVNSVMPVVAAMELHNYDEPTTHRGLETGEVEAISRK